MGVKIFSKYIRITIPNIMPISPSVNPAIALPLGLLTTMPIKPKKTAILGINQPIIDNSIEISEGNPNKLPTGKIVLKMAVTALIGIHIDPKTNEAVPNPFPIVFTS